MLKEVILNNEEESRICAQSLAKTLKPNDIVLFTGDLGSGKTFFCREIIKYFCGGGIQVTSPTFNILQIYKAENFLIYHYDFYRIKSSEEFLELGVDEALKNNLCLIEWPEIIMPLLPKSLIEINIEIIKNDKRLCTINIEK